MICLDSTKCSNNKHNNKVLSKMRPWILNSGGPLSSIRRMFLIRSPFFFRVSWFHCTVHGMLENENTKSYMHSYSCDRSLFNITHILPTQKATKNKSRIVDTTRYKYIWSFYYKTLTVFKLSSAACRCLEVAPPNFHHAARFLLPPVFARRFFT